MRHIEEIEEVWFGVYGLISFGFFSRASLCMLSSGQGTLVAPQAHGGGHVPKFTPQKSFYSLADCSPKFLP